MSLTLRTFLPFFVFVFFFKFAGSLEYTLSAPLGERFFPVWVVGILVGGATFVQLLLDVPAGHLLDKHGYRRLLGVGTVLFVGVVLFLVPGLTATTYLCMTALSAISWLFFTPGVNAYLLAQAPKNMSGHMIAWKDTASSLAVVLGSGFLGFFLLQGDTTLGVLFVVSFVCAGCALYLAPREYVRIHDITHTIENRHYHIHRTYVTDILRAVRRLNPASTLLLLSSSTSSIFYAVVWFVVPLQMLHAAENGIPAFALGIFDLAVVLLGSYIGMLVDSRDKKVLVLWGLLMFAVAASALGFMADIFFLVFGFLATTGEELSTVALWSWLHTLDRDHQNDGLVAGLISFAQDLGWAVGPVVAGFAYLWFGAAGCIFATGALVFVVWLVSLYLTAGVSIPAAHDVLHRVPRKPHTKRYKH